MIIVAIFAIILGFFGIIFGFWGQKALPRPYDTLAAVALPLSLILGLGGVLLLCVPHFFDDLIQLLFQNKIK